MPICTWDASYSVKVKRFDEDHKQLFRIVNELYDGMIAKHGQEVLAHVLTELVDYTKSHFAGEEAAMKAAGYPQLQAHVEQHHAFVQQINEVEKGYKAGDIGLSIQVFNFLVDWLKKHIVASDKLYSDFLNAKGVI
jgi:hemerythrin